jgi:hypothetical protein
VCPTETSRRTAEELLDLGFSHPVEIVGHRDLPGHEPEPANPTCLRCFQRHHLDQRLAGLGDDERLAFGGAIEQPREVRFGFVMLTVSIRTKLN